MKTPSVRFPFHRFLKPTSLLVAIILFSVPSIAAAQVLYSIDDSDRIATPTTLLGVSVYAATDGGIWRLLNGDTYQMNSGLPENIQGLPDGASLVSIASSTSSTMYAYAVPEPSTITLLLLGAGILTVARRRYC